MNIKKSKGDRIREYIIKHPEQKNKQVADKFKTVPSYVHKVRKELYPEYVSSGMIPVVTAKNTRVKVLENAKQLVNKDRAEVYGDSKINHDRIAKLWSVILGKEITSQQVIMCMTALKLARLVETPDHTDTWTDICGYGALGGEDD